jgi:hypothetical protein
VDLPPLCFTAQKPIVGIRDIALTDDKLNREIPPKTLSSDSTTAYTSIPQLDEEELWLLPTVVEIGEYSWSL